MNKCVSSAFQFHSKMGDLRSIRRKERESARLRRSGCILNVDVCWLMFFTIQTIIKAIALVHNIMRELALDGILVKRSPSGLMPKKYIVDGENIRASWKDYFMAEYPQNEIRWTMENSLIEMFRMEQQNYAKIFGWQWQKSWR